MTSPAVRPQGSLLRRSGHFKAEHSGGRLAEVHGAPGLAVSIDLRNHGRVKPVASALACTCPTTPGIVAGLLTDPRTDNDTAWGNLANDRMEAQSTSGLTAVA